MTDSSEAEVPPHSNGISDSLDEEDRAKIRPADIDADVREMERRKRVEVIMNSKLFREELERIIETQLKDGSGTSGLMQQISDMMGVNKQAGNVFKNSNCVLPINDIRGIEAMGYGKGEKILRCKLAAVFRLIDLYGWTQGTNTLVTARLNQDEEHFLVNPYGMMFHEITASSLIKVAMQGDVVEQGTTNFSVNIAAFSLHAAVHAARPDIKCIVNLHTPSVVAVSALKHGILPLSQESVVIGDFSTHACLGGLLDPEEKDKLARNLGPNNKVLLLSNQGALCCGETIEEAFFNARNTVLACESQLKLLPAGIDNLVLLSDETRKKIYDAAHKAPESSPRPDQPSILESKVERKWRVGGVEFEALMRMLDNAGFRTGYIYRHPLVKGDPPKPKNDVELPPAVSSLGYLLEEEELYRQGLWRKLEGGRKGHDRSRWLNSPNVYQKVEILETGTPDPKKITKWVADGSPTHSTSTPVRIDAALQFVPIGTNPKEFKQRQQQIKDYRRADKISAGPQSHILEGVTWEEARKMQDATVTQTGDQVVLMGAASKGIIQRGHQHNAMVYKSPYAKNPFDSVTDEELDEYKKVVEKKVKGEYDTDYSESEGLSSAQINRRIGDHLRSPTSVTSETEDESRNEPRVLRIETKHVPRPSQPEVVLSDVEPSSTERFLRAERVSVNSQKNLVDVVKLPTRIKKNARSACRELNYRTNNYAGLPKGSYCVPNPKHFHIVRESQVAQRMRPVLIRIGHGPSASHGSHYIFNRFNCNYEGQRSTVSINMGNLRTVSLGMPVQTIRDFITPFAKALNLLQAPAKNSQACQTAYMNNDAETSPLPFKESDFEEQILWKMRENLLTKSIDSDSDDGSSENDDVVDFNNPNGKEGMAEMTAEEEEMSMSSSGEEEKKVPDKESSSQIIKIAELAKEMSGDLEGSLATAPVKIDNIALEPVKHGKIEMSLATKDSEIESGRADNPESEIDKAEELETDDESFQSLPPEAAPLPDDFSIDEGIGDVSAVTPPVAFKAVNPDEKVLQLAKVVIDYMSEQTLNIKELILFPELDHDSNTNKFFVKLTSLYRELYPTIISSEDKNKLRLDICSYILNLIGTKEVLNHSSDSSDSEVVSDKIFSISEFLSEIMDYFFNLVDDRDDLFEHFSPTENCNVHHSTPTGITPVYEVVEEVTGFKKDKSKKSGSETFWFSISSPTERKVSPVKSNRAVVNVDEIPLRPPDDWARIPRSTRILAPIPEEPRRNLLQEFEMESASGCDLLAGGDNNQTLSHSYVAFDKPEKNVVLSNCVHFFRTLTTNSSSYVKADEVIFEKKKINGQDFDSEDEGDWMGFEGAKF